MFGRSNILRLVLLVVLVVLPVCVYLMQPDEQVVVVETVKSINYLSPIDLVVSSDGDLYVAEYTANQIAVYDANKEAIKEMIPLPLRPSGIALSTDGKKLFVTGDAPQGKVFVVDTEVSQIEDTIDVGYGPNSPVLDKKRNRLYVCNQFSNDLSVIDLNLGEEALRIAMQREPVDAKISHDGAYLYVVNQLANFYSAGDYASAMVSVVDLDRDSVIERIPLPRGSTSVRGIGISPLGDYVYITHVLARYKATTTQLDFGWINTNAMTVVDAKSFVPLTTLLLDELNKGAANPYDVEVNKDADKIYVTTSGTNELLIIDRNQLHRRIEYEHTNVRGRSTTGKSISTDLHFLDGIRERIKLPGKGVKSLCVKDSKVYIAEYYSDDIVEVLLKEGLKPDIKVVKLGEEKKLTQVRKGEILFHDAEVCYQWWQSCSSCHPGVRSDALEWDLLNDGVGNPKNTKSLVNSHITPPAMSLGVRKDAETGVRAGIKYILFNTLAESDAMAIDAYLRSLKPLRSPHLVRGELSPKAQNGKELFGAFGCSSCHSGEVYTDLKKHNIGTGRGSESLLTFDTPSLLEAWRTSPYLHDGSAYTIKDAIRHHNFIQEKELSRDDLDRLAEYVSSL